MHNHTQLVSQTNLRFTNMVNRNLKKNKKTTKAYRNQSDFFVCPVILTCVTHLRKKLQEYFQSNIYSFM